MKKKHKMWLCAYLFVAPTMIGVMVLNLWPVVQSIFYSFNEVKGFMPPKFIGIDNYIRLLEDKELVRAIVNTFKYAVLSVPIGVLLSLVVAVLLNAKIKLKGTFRFIYFLPVVSAPAAVSLVWKWLFSSEFGLINELLGKVGISDIGWLSDGKYALIAIVIVGVWSMLGYNMIILLAGLQEVPKELYEAAAIDGAGSFSKFFRVTVPMVSPTLFFVTLTTVMSALQVFDTVYMMIKPGTIAFKSVESIVYLFYRYTFKNSNIGYGSAIMVMLFLIILVLTLIQTKLQKKWVYYNGE